MFSSQNQLGLAKQASTAVENLLNHFAKDGWEYVRSEEFFADFFKSGAASFFGDKNNPRLQMFIFRQQYTEEMEKRMADEEQERIEAERAAHKQTGKIMGEMPEVTDARCPNCDSLVNKLDQRCWKCDASFSELSAWRPQPL